MFGRIKYFGLITFFLIYSQGNAINLEDKNKILNQIENIKLNSNVKESMDLSNLIFKFRNRMISASTIKVLYDIQSKNKNLPILTAEKLIDPEQPQYFSLFILDIFMIKNKGIVVTGIVSSGTIKIGDIVTIKKANGKNIDTICFDIHFFKTKTKKVSAGQTIGVFLKDIRAKDIEQGDMVYHENS